MEDLKKILCSLLAFICLVLICSISKGYACSCSEPAPPLESLEVSKAVFVGKVTDIDRELFGNNETVTLTVSSAWKGISTTEVHVTTSSDEASCGYNFELGKEYLVYTLQDKMETNICTRTSLLSDADEDLAAFQTVELLPNSSFEKMKSESNFLLIVGFALLVIIFVGFGLRWKYKQS